MRARTHTTRVQGLLNEYHCSGPHSNTVRALRARNTGSTIPLSAPSTAAGTLEIITVGLREENPNRILCVGYGNQIRIPVPVNKHVIHERGQRGYSFRMWSWRHRQGSV